MPPVTDANKVAAVLRDEARVVVEMGKVGLVAAPMMSSFGRPTSRAVASASLNAGAR